MSLFAAFDDIAVSRPQVVSIGVFDGVHRGHYFLLSQAAQLAQSRGAEVMAVTFWPPPVLVLRPESPVHCLMLGDEKCATLAALPVVHHVLTLPFTVDLARRSAADFLEDLRSRLEMVALVEGEDFTLGHNREGTITWLTDYGRANDIALLPIAKRAFDDATISSTRIRRLLEVGAVEQAGELLGRPYHVRGEIVHGDGRGRSLGYPTANLNIPPLKLIPANGIYAVRAWLSETPQEVWQGAASIGVRPVFGGQDVRVEVYLLDIDRDLYGRVLEVDIIRRLRSEQHFASVDALVTQMAEDVAETRRVLAQQETGAPR